MDNAELFKFAAKAGSLEGYLYERQKLEPLINWMGNIETLYAALPASVQKDIRGELAAVLTRTLAYGESTLDSEIKTRLSKLLSSL